MPELRYLHESTPRPRESASRFHPAQSSRSGLLAPPVNPETAPAAEVAGAGSKKAVVAANARALAVVERGTMLTAEKAGVLLVAVALTL